MELKGSAGSDARRGGREAKFRQAAFVYLHVGIIYEAAVWSMGGAGVLPVTRGPIWVWLLIGVAIVAVVFWGLWWWQNPWFARAIWALHALRLPSLIGGAFLREVPGRLPSSFYLFAIVIVLINLWMLARAGWDL